MVEDILSSLGARGLGTEQPGTPDSDPALVSSGFAQQLPSSGLTSQMLSSGNKQAGTEEFKFCIFMSVKQRLFPPSPSDHSCCPIPSPSPVPGDAWPEPHWNKSDTREPDSHWSSQDGNLASQTIILLEINKTCQSSRFGNLCFFTWTQSSVPPSLADVLHMNCITYKVCLLQANVSPSLLHFFYFNLKWKVQYRIQMLLHYTGFWPLEKPHGKNDFTNLKYQLNNFAALLSAWLNFLIISFYFFPLSLCFTWHFAFACLILFLYLKKKKKIIAPVSALASCQYFYPVDVSHRQEHQEIAQKAEPQSSSKKEANLNAKAWFGVVPVLAHTKCWLQGCRQGSAGWRNKR